MDIEYHMTLTTIFSVVNRWEMDEYEDDRWNITFIQPSPSSSKTPNAHGGRSLCCAWFVAIDESPSQELLSDLLSDLRKLFSAMEPAELRLFGSKWKKKLEEEDEEDTHMRNNTLTPLLRFVCPIFKPKPDVYPVFQVIITIFAICILVITVAASSRTVTRHEFSAISIS